MSNIAIIDVEASGLHFDSYPIEVAVLKEDETRCWLIKPEPNWNYWCDTAESLHCISRTTLERDGLPAAEVVKLLGEFLENFNGVLYSDADRWDADWMDTLYWSVKQPRPFHIRSIYELMSEDMIQKFDLLKSELANTGRFRRHRARDDVLMIAEAFELAKQQ